MDKELALCVERRARLEGCFEAKLGKDFKEIMSKVREFLLSEKQKKKQASPT